MMEDYVSIIDPKEELLRDWSDLPPELLDMILSKVFYVFDYIRFGAVCKTWRFVALHQKQRRIKAIHEQPPLLLIKNRNSQSYKLYNVGEDRFYNPELKFPRISRKRDYCGSSYGWVATHKMNGSVKLVNPFTGKMIGVGFGDGFTNCNCYFEKVILSCDPADEGCDLFLGGLLTVEYKAQFYHCLAFKRAAQVSSSSSSWIVAKRRPIGHKFLDIIFHQGLLYALEDNYRIIAINYQCSNYSSESTPALQIMTAHVIPQRYHLSYLVEASNGDLLIVLVRLGFINPGVELKVYKLVNKSLVEIFELNEEDSIFLTSDSMVMCPYSSSSVPNFNKNSIYLTAFSDPAMNRSDVYVFRTDSQTCSIASEGLKILQCQPCSLIWVTPTLC